MAVKYISYQLKKITDRYYSNDLPDMDMKVEIEALWEYWDSLYAKVTWAETTLKKYVVQIAEEWYDAKEVKEADFKEAMWDQTTTKEEKEFLDSITPIPKTKEEK